jgi:SAM-dependent methyltransferase
MFFSDLAAAFTNIARSLVPDGRLALLAWQPLEGNEWIREISGALAAGRDRGSPPPDAPGPFALADPDRVRRLLTSAGYSDIELDGSSADMWFGTDAEDAHRFVIGLMGWMLEGLDDAGRDDALRALRETMVRHETGDGVMFGSAAWTIRATRTR